MGTACVKITQLGSYRPDGPRPSLRSAKDAMATTTTTTTRERRQMANSGDQRPADRTGYRLRPGRGFGAHCGRSIRATDFRTFSRRAGRLRGLGRVGRGGGGEGRRTR